MRTSFARAVCAALSLGFGVAAFAAPSFHSGLTKGVHAILQDEEDQTPALSEWMMPSAIQSGLVDRGVSFLVGDTYANYQGRTFELKHEQVKLGLADSFELFYGRQFILAKGRASTSRLNEDSDYYGGRVLVKRPTDQDSSAASIQFETFRPGNASLISVSGTTTDRETLDATISNIYSVNYGDRSGNQFQLAYATVNANAGINSKSYNAGFGKDFKLSDETQLRLQATLLQESLSGAFGSSSSGFKEIVSGIIDYNPAKWLTIEGDLTAMPSGMPYVSGDFTGVSSFAVYQPGGIVNDLKSDFIALGSLRIMAHWKF